MNEPFLILHKVRGEPAFDIAIILTKEGTNTDPGPWWIIPTSGHRAYPVWYFQLKMVDDDITYDAMQLEIPDDWPDHYQYDLDRSIDKSPIKSIDMQNVLAALIPIKPIQRRI